MNVQTKAFTQLQIQKYSSVSEWSEVASKVADTRQLPSNSLANTLAHTVNA